MSGILRISLKAGERIFVNGAELRADRKVTLEILNEVTFFLEQHIMAPEDVTTPMRQLYFLVQAMVMQGERSDDALESCSAAVARFAGTQSDARIADVLTTAADALTRRRPFEALRAIRQVLPLEPEQPRQAAPHHDRPAMPPRTSIPRQSTVGG